MHSKFGGMRRISNTYRFAMTIEVETPAGIRTGSSVYEVKASRTLALLPDEAKRDWSVVGEAVAVDLPNGQTLYALLRTDAHFGDMVGLSMATIHPDFRGTGYDVVGVAEELSAGRYSGPSQVSPENYPMLVTFEGESDPTSVALVDPDDLAATFGEGVSLRRITLELTDDPVTRGIEGRLPKPDRKGFFNWDGQTNPNEGLVVGIWDFIQGAKE